MSGLRDELAALHRNDGEHWCISCGTSYPCETRALLDRFPPEAEGEAGLAHEWAVDFSQVGPHPRQVRDGWARYGNDREAAVEAAARLLDGRLMHRRVSPWRYAASDPVALAALAARPDTGEGAE